MLYALLIHAPDAHYEALPPDGLEALLERFFVLKREMQAAGVFRGGEHLHPATCATTVGLEHGQALITDGPFAETKEQFGGFILIEVPHLDEALAWARRVPAFEYGHVEVRPVWDHSDRGTPGAAPRAWPTSPPPRTPADP